MPKAIKKSKKITLDDLAIMINEGFVAVDERFTIMENDISGLKNDVSGLKKSVFNLSCDVKDLKAGQEKHTKEINELKDVVNGVFRIEMMEMKKRMAVVEERLGIVS